MDFRLRVLLIEDDDVDAESVYRAAAPYADMLEIIRETNAQVALSNLRARGKKPFFQRPYIIVLELNLPGMKGIEFLREVRLDALLATSPIFVLTADDDPLHRKEVEQHKVLAYVTKSRFFEESPRFIVLLLHYLSHRLKLAIRRQPSAND